ncbi:MAG: hypothetical protein ACYTEQ_06640 [Planctomycetota bacterium]|jgi:hypothetical protein
MKPEVHTKENGHSDLVADAHGPELSLYDLDTDELIQAGNEIGIDWSQTRHQRNIAKAKSTARETTQIDPPRVYKWTFNGFIMAGNLFIVGVMSLIQSMFGPLAVLGLAYAEFLRVRSGVAMFDPDNAVLLAGALLIFALIIQFVYHSNDVINKTKEYQPSLRLHVRKVKYWLGIGKDWKPKARTAWDRLITTKAWSRFGIIFLGTVGVLNDDLSGDAATQWYLQLWRVTAYSNLNTMLALVGGGVLSAILLQGLDWAFGHTYLKFEKLVPQGVDFLSDTGATWDAEQAALNNYLRAQIVQRQSKVR